MSIYLEVFCKIIWNKNAFQCKNLIFLQVYAILYTIGGMRHDRNPWIKKS